ncbi:baseplate J/gp47 family protein [Salmonella enterica subsp. enterica serovar Pomona]|uniref:baseplate J/gp47 family protein n=1 Tax=Salmonella enterica TaxID=28901 RepID=UPI0008FC9B11|nr:baseplate J/gp47 family protein [Salmonella enterica]EAN3269643.1 baseplate J/gp47 family protein [Salmonella enterica subsp. enterica serovar Oranienburg]ECX5678394.1 baseplate J/gp47 family protein [Salmonella enterica subsp. enterica serovar Newport]EDJ3201242.1 phage baseplate protein [Salmonella enterica subsp. enterica serovar Poona]EAA8715995.1 baseplate J/gp47 family protein [Salmonella enterica subsp. enterica serovar Pomona]EAS2324021.1 baseplate J/gp47 family protein [Salmonella 
MPYQRPVLSELRSRNRQFITSELKNTGELLRFSNLRILADMDAGMSHLHFAYLDWIARQSNPFTAEDEWLAAWGALKNVYRKDASAATCPNVMFKRGNEGAVIPSGSLLNRNTGVQYRLDHVVTIGADKTGTGSITAVLPEIGSSLTVADGNAPAGTTLTLDCAIDGVDSAAVAVEAISGGANMESPEAFRQRVLQAYQSVAEGGSEDDYRRWALEVPGVTRAWVSPRLLGAGSVGLYFMCDGDDRTNHGFPVGTDGVATKETYHYGKATGDQLRVADYIFPLRPATTLVWACSPLQNVIDFDIGGIPDVGADVVAAIESAIDEVFFDDGVPGGKIFLSDLSLAIGAIDGTRGFVLNQPSGTYIQLKAGALPVRGQIRFTGGTS